MFLTPYWKLLKLSANQWYNNNLSRLAAALSYYTIFSLAPLLIISITFAGTIFEKNNVQEAFLNNIQALIGANGADQVKTMINITIDFSRGNSEAIVSLFILILGASGFFAQLQEGINTVWGVETRSGRGIIGFIVDRFLSFAMVMGLSLLLLISTLYSIGLNYLYSHAYYSIPANKVIISISTSIITFLIITLIFAIIFKILPDIKIKWRNVWVGSFLTAFLFTVGKYILACYFSRVNFSSTFGAAGSLIIILVWVYYSAQILLFGAQFTKEYAMKYSKNTLRVSKNAIAFKIIKKGRKIY